MAPPSTRDIIRYKEVRRADALDDQKTALQILAAEVSALTQEQLQEFVLSQIKRIIHGNNPGYWRDDFVAAGIPSLSDLVASPSSPTFLADCLATDVINTAAYITGPAVLGIPQVTKADITTPGKYPAIGLIIQKLTLTRCVVQVLGNVSLSPGSLIPGKTYFVGTSATPTPVPPTAPFGGIAAIQALGIALDADRLLLSVNPSRFIRAG